MVLCPVGKGLNWTEGCFPTKLDNAMVNNDLEPMLLVTYMVSTVCKFTTSNSTSVYSLCCYILRCEMVRSHKTLNLQSTLNQLRPIRWTANRTIETREDFIRLALDTFHQLSTSWNIVNQSHYLSRVPYLCCQYRHQVKNKLTHSVLNITSSEHLPSLHTRNIRLDLRKLALLTC